MIFILRNTSSFLWVQTNKKMICGTFFKKVITQNKACAEIGGLMENNSFSKKFNCRIL
jgi:hypothetical protein